jgi:hypothetical protein
LASPFTVHASLFSALYLITFFIVSGYRDPEGMLAGYLILPGMREGADAALEAVARAL